MIETRETVIERVIGVLGSGEDLFMLARRAVAGLKNEGICGVIAATFSNCERFPSLAVRMVDELGLGPETPAFDLQMACSAYPYAIYLAGKLAEDLGGKVLVVDGDVQSCLVNKEDHDTGAIFSDAVSATVVSAGETVSRWKFLSVASDDLRCTANGPICMDGFKVFTFVAKKVGEFLRDFEGYSIFAPHQANPYMVRQLAKAIGAEHELVTIPDSWKNPGSCSVALALGVNAARVAGKKTLITGFGAGYSVAAGIVGLATDFEGEVR